MAVERQKKKKKEKGKKDRKSGARPFADAVKRGGQGSHSSGEREGEGKKEGALLGGKKSKRGGESHHHQKGRKRKKKKKRESLFSLVSPGGRGRGDFNLVRDREGKGTRSQFACLEGEGGEKGIVSRSLKNQEKKRERKRGLHIYTA